MSEIDVNQCKYYKMARCPEGYSCEYYCCNCYYKQLQQLKATLDEIEKVVANNISYMDTASTTDAMKEVLQLIKQAKEVKNNE